MGQVAVAHVIINRVHSNRYPGTVCEVVYQPYQFTGLRRSYRPSEDKYWKIVLETSILSYIGFIDDPTNGALNYYAHKGPQALDQDPWPGMTKLADIGNHRFKCGRRK